MAEPRDATKRRPHPLITKYLLLYNGLQCVGWILILVIMIAHYLESDNCAGLWKKEEYFVKFFQTLMAIEVVHAAVRIVPSNPLVTAIQIASRVFVVWGVVHSFARIHNSITIPLLLTAWSVTEITRYSYYALNLFSAVPYALIWCRYTFFILLYPLGVIGEVLTTIFALPYIRDSNRYSITLPNFANVSFNYYFVVIVALLLYVPGFPQMYFHMLRQRKKVLSPDKAKKIE